ncbi:Ca2+-binding protein, RTX toxin [Xenococcus sp. PCC 7305]|uniref:CRTAC homolog protein n=1 Tax=Xenococcus sp. PCC 7305 TaxID=102125 RepID=UPI0002ACDB79|nr:CRTAC homolog protein [Xenococcus sp. PCC 7305]ELS00471.1 Ca2+-binding protein, RTX toxin [Xenococcus sp. PCC 7305]
MVLQSNTFQDTAETAGITWSRQRGDEAISVSWLDYNSDGLVDLWISGHGYNGAINSNNAANQVLFPDAKFPFLYINNGNGTFTNLLDEDWRQGSGGDTHGSTWIDADNDGDPDVFVAGGGQLGGIVGDGRGQSNHFFVNRFRDSNLLTNEAENNNIGYKLARTRAAIWFDGNNDGLLDFVNLVAARPDGSSANAYFEQQPNGTFIDRSEAVGFDVPGSSRYGQLADFTGDGKLDLIIQGTFEFPLKVYDISSGNSFVDVTSDYNFPLTSDIPINNEGNPDQSEDFADHESARDTIIADFDGDGNNDIFLVRSRHDIDHASVSQNNDRIVAADLVFSNAVPETGYSFRTTGTVAIDFFSPNALPIDINPSQIFIGSSGRNPTAAELEAFINISSETTETATSNDNPRTNEVDRVSALALNPNSANIGGIKSDRSARGIYIGYNANNQTWQVRVNGYNFEKIRSAVESTANITNLQAIGFTNVDPLENALSDQLWIYNEATGQYEDSSVAAGLTELTNAQSAVAADFDNDKDLDIYISNSYATYDQPNILYENQGDGTFIKVTLAGGAQSESVGPVWLDFETGSKLATADVNNDGAIDIFSSSTITKSPRKTYLGNTSQLFENQGNNNNWLQIKLVGIESNRDGIGAQVRVTSGGTTQLREQNSGTHNFAQNDQRLHFGLGQDEQINRVEIKWPSGRTQILNNVSVNQILTVTEPFSNNVMGDENNDSLVGGVKADRIEGLAGNDTIVGLRGNDRLIGDAGNDSLVGGADSDTLMGGVGSDLLRGGDDNDYLTGGDGFDRLEGNNGDDTIKGEGGNDFIFGGIGFDSLVGNDGKDTINGDGDDDYIDGGNNRDTLRGNAGNDTIKGGIDFDLIEGGAGNDSIEGNQDSDLLFGGLGKDTIDGGEGADIIRGQQGDDLVSGGSGDDTINGGGGFDTLNGGNGNDYLDGEGSQDTLNGGNGSDTLKGGNSNDLLNGGAGYDIIVETGDFNFTITDSKLIGRGIDSFNNIEAIEIFGGGGVNVLDGSAVTSLQLQLNGRGARDTLIGGAGDDLITGGAAVDVMTGGDGNDRFIYTSRGDRNDTITDFTSGEDAIVIDRSAFGIELELGVLDESQFVLGNVAVDENTRFIYNANNDRLLFDSDGTGSNEAIVITNFSNNPTLENTDISVIS